VASESTKPETLARRWHAEPLLVDATVAAHMLSLSPRSLWSLTARAEIPCVRVGARKLYSVEVLRAWVAAKSKGAQG
jgi:hypothetical protein